MHASQELPSLWTCRSIDMQVITRPAPMFRCPFLGTTLAVSSRAPQCRQTYAGRIKAAIDGKNLAGDVVRAVTAKKIHRLRQFVFEAVTVERDRVVVVGTDLGAVDRLRHRGIDRPRRH